jgi:HAD superfamily hydrolase (TIGR01509 family)
MLPRAVRGVVFDMDGLLVDTESVFRDAMMEVSARRGHDLPLSVFLRMVGLPREGSRAVAMAHFGDDFDYGPWIAEVSEAAHARLQVGVTVKAGVTELLDDLDAGGVPCAVATSSGHATVELQLGPNGLLRRFQAIVAAGDYALGKPAPDPYLEAARRLGVDPIECLALEDSHNGVRAAHAAGMMTIMVPDLLAATEEMHALCVTIVRTLHDVRDLIVWTNASS